ncbi:MAG TPA: AAA family ATPase [Nakamurella sp.]
MTTAVRPTGQGGAAPFGTAPLAGRVRVPVTAAPVLDLAGSSSRVAGPNYAPLMELVERDHQLAVLRAAVAGSPAGEGSGIAVAGEPGVGKSALIAAACRTDSAVRLLRASCDPLSTPRPLGPFRDLAAEAGYADTLVRDDLMLSEICEEIYRAVRNEPTVLVIEDLHWVDAASIDVLRFLANRVSSMPLALLVSYRDHEIGPGHSARVLLGDFARLDALTTLRLDPLSPAGVRELLAGTGLDPDRVHALTGGNPFFVTEVAKDPGLPLPGSVRDAVLARTSDVTAEDFEVLQLVATAPDRLDDRALPALGVDLPTLRRLDTTGLLTRTRDGLVFRHELARQAVESTIPPGGAPRLHARLVAALEQIQRPDPAVLTHHAVGARDSARAARYARKAAQEAINARSHTEAAAFFRTALDNMQDAPPGERGRLLLQLGFEQYMTSRLKDAIATVSATFPLWSEAGDPGGLAAAHVSVALFEYYNARRRQAEDHADRAVAIAGESGPDLTLGMASATRGYFAYMRNDFELALTCEDEAGRIAEHERNDELSLRTRFVRISAALAGGDDAARSRFTDLIEDARTSNLDELASTGYSNLVNLDVEQRRLREAQHILDESLPFSTERDIPICRHWQTGVRSRLHFARGHWSAALEDAGFVLDEEGMPLATVWPLLVSGLIPLRQGIEDPSAEPFETAWRLIGLIDEPLRRLAVLSALAERMWMTAVPDPRVTELAPGELARLTIVPGTSWAAGDLAVWLTRLGLLADRSVPVAEPFRLTLDSRPDRAAAWWRRTGEPFAEAMAWADSPEPVDRKRAVEMLDALGAIGTADRIRAALRREGVAQVPARPRVTTRSNPAGLTNRQLDVAKLVARGFTNAEIAARLFISPKTADHHVSAVLTKLGVANRRAVVVQADEFGLG